mmetsp:Transcript_10543/g.23735  ORF Transcript_10543/g.23735 Transcript_10543/m.23735 type:complete len:268 (+) Transcript_10543:127-930(+)
MPTRLSGIAQRRHAPPHHRGTRIAVLVVTSMVRRSTIRTVSCDSSASLKVPPQSNREFSKAATPQPQREASKPCRLLGAFRGLSCHTPSRGSRDSKVARTRPCAKCELPPMTWMRPSCATAPAPYLLAAIRGPATQEPLPKSKTSTELPPSNSPPPKTQNSPPRAAPAAYSRGSLMGLSGSQPASETAAPSPSAVSRLRTSASRSTPLAERPPVTMRRFCSTPLTRPERSCSMGVTGHQPTPSSCHRTRSSFSTELCRTSPQRPPSA